MNRAIILAAIQNANWAITPESLATIVAVASEGSVNVEGFPKTGQGGYEGVGALADRDGISSRTGKTKYYNIPVGKSTQKVALIEFAGPVFRRANLMTEHSGATSLEMMVKELNLALSDKTIGSIVIDYDSPGGEVNGTREMANLIHKGRKIKPIIGYASYMAASAAYWNAAASTELYLDPTASVGSIGVVRTIQKGGDEGIFEIVSSQSPDKRPDPETKEGKAAHQAQVDALADVFIGEVATYRGVSPEKVISDFGRGGVLVGQAAVNAGMADGVANFDEVLNRAAVLASDFRKPKSALKTNMEENENIEGELALAELQKETAALKEQLAAFAEQARIAGENTASLAAALKESKAEARKASCKLVIEKAVADGVINAGSSDLVYNILNAASELDEINAAAGREQIAVTAGEVTCVGVGEMIRAVLDAKSQALVTDSGSILSGGTFVTENGSDDFDIDAEIKRANEERGYKS